jgi:hypothetical protein
LGVRIPPSALQSSQLSSIFACGNDEQAKWSGGREMMRTTENDLIKEKTV